MSILSNIYVYAHLANSARATVTYVFGHAELNKEMRIPQAKGSEPASLELISVPSLSMPNTDSKLQIMLVHDLHQELDDQAKKV